MYIFLRRTGGGILFVWFFSWNCWCCCKQAGPVEFHSRQHIRLSTGVKCRAEERRCPRKPPQNTNLNSFCARNNTNLLVSGRQNRRPDRRNLELATNQSKKKNIKKRWDREIPQRQWWWFAYNRLGTAKVQSSTKRRDGTPLTNSFANLFILGDGIFCLSFFPKEEDE